MLSSLWASLRVGPGFGHTLHWARRAHREAWGLKGRPPVRAGRPAVCPCQCTCGRRPGASSAEPPPLRAAWAVSRRPTGVPRGLGPPCGRAAAGQRPPALVDFQVGHGARSHDAHVHVDALSVEGAPRPAIRPPARPSQAPSVQIGLQYPPPTNPRTVRNGQHPRRPCHGPCVRKECRGRYVGSCKALAGVGRGGGTRGAVRHGAARGRGTLRTRA